VLNVVKKIQNKINGNYDYQGVTIAFLGDSVTQGCFEVYRKSEECIETVFDKTSAYHKYFTDIFSVLCPSVPVNVINAGISGGSVQHALSRLERDVIAYNPDLVVVCFGLNDSCSGLEGLFDYINGLKVIFEKMMCGG